MLACIKYGVKTSIQQTSLSNISFWCVKEGVKIEIRIFEVLLFAIKYQNLMCWPKILIFFRTLTLSCSQVSAVFVLTLSCDLVSVGRVK